MSIADRMERQAQQYLLEFRSEHIYRSEPKEQFEENLNNWVTFVDHSLRWGGLKQNNLKGKRNFYFAML